MIDDPERWPKIVDTLQGQGPTPPPCEPIKRLSGIEARLDEFGWQVRPCSTGGYFAWCPTGTQYCATWRELGAFASKVKYAARKAAAEVKKPTEPIPVMSRSEQKNAARNRRVELKAAFMDCLARVLARTTARRGDQQVEN